MICVKNFGQSRFNMYGIYICFVVVEVAVDDVCFFLVSPSQSEPQGPFPSSHLTVAQN